MSALLNPRKLLLSRAAFVISDADILIGERAGPGLDLVPQYRWTLAEKQVWAPHIKDSILKNDNQRAMPSGMVVERETISKKMAPGLQCFGEKKADSKLATRE